MKSVIAKPETSLTQKLTASQMQYLYTRPNGYNAMILSSRNG
jgi:hypothetical protein